MKAALHVARKALCKTLASPGPIAGLYALNLFFTAAIAMLFARNIRANFGDHPPLDVIDWIVSVRHTPRLGLTLARTGATALVAYLLVGYPLTAAALGHLTGAAQRPLGLIHTTVQLVVLDLLVWFARLATLAIGVVAAYGLQHWSSDWRLEDWLVPLHLLTALPSLTLLALLSLLRHHAVPLLVAGRRSAWRALGASLQLTRQRPGLALALWAAYWSVGFTATAVALGIRPTVTSLAVTSAAQQILAASKSLLLVWAWSCTLTLAPVGWPYPTQRR